MSKRLFYLKKKKDDLEVVLEEQDAEGVIECIGQLFDEPEQLQPCSSKWLQRLTPAQQPQRRFDENFTELEERMMTAYTTPMKLSSSQCNSSSTKKRSPFQDVTHKFDESSSKKSSSKFQLYSTPGKDNAHSLLKYR